MAFPAPSPEHAIDSVIDITKDAFAARMSVIHRPALDLEVQGLNQFPRRAVASLLLKYFPDLGQERFHALLRRTQQYLTAGVASNGLTQEIEAVFAMRDSGLLAGEL